MKDYSKALDYIAIDFETANTYRNSACSVGLVRFINGKETDSFYSLIKPAKMYFIPEWTEEIHHISYGDVKDKPYFPEVWDNFVMPFINRTPGIPMVAHNAPFDFGVIQGCCSYYGMPLPALEYFDSLPLARNAWPLLDCHKLTYLAEVNGITYNAHEALDDARTCGKLVNLAAEQNKCLSVEQLLEKFSIPLRMLQE